jgi:hypothetical protein
MRKSIESENQPLITFGTVKEAAMWTLERLNARREKSFWGIRSKYGWAIVSLNEDNWQPAQRVVKLEYNSWNEMLENARMRASLPDSNLKIDPASRLFVETAFHGILYCLINQAAELRTYPNTSSRDQLKNDMQKYGVLISIREYPRNLSEFSKPQLLGELGILAAKISIAKK